MSEYRGGSRTDPNHHTARDHSIWIVSEPKSDKVATIRNKSIAMALLLHLEVLLLALCSFLHPRYLEREAENRSQDASVMSCQIHTITSLFITAFLCCSSECLSSLSNSSWRFFFLSAALAPERPPAKGMRACLGASGLAKCPCAGRTSSFQLSRRSVNCS